MSQTELHQLSVAELAAQLRAKFGDDVFAEGETSLAQATLDALLEKRKLLVAVDEPTGRLLGSLLQPLPHSEAVFDFGTESYADPQKSRRITVPEQLLRRFPGDIVQAAAGRALAARAAAGHGVGAVAIPQKCLAVDQALMRRAGSLCGCYIIPGQSGLLASDNGHFELLAGSSLQR